MKNLFILFIASIFSFVTVSAQQHKDDYKLFIQAGTGMQDNMVREIADMGVEINNKHRLTLYTESFITEQGHGYRKFFGGARYSYKLALTPIISIIPNLGVDMRLSGANMISVRPQVAANVQVTKEFGFYISTGYQQYITKDDPGVKQPRKFNFTDARTRLEAGINIRL